MQGFRWISTPKITKTRNETYCNGKSNKHAQGTVRLQLSAPGRNPHPSCAVRLLANMDVVGAGLWPWEGPGSGKPALSTEQCPRGRWSVVGGCAERGHGPALPGANASTSLWAMPHGLLDPTLAHIAGHAVRSSLQPTAPGSQRTGHTSRQAEARHCRARPLRAVPASALRPRLLAQAGPRGL